MSVESSSEPGSEALCAKTMEQLQRLVMLPSAVAMAGIQNPHFRLLHQRAPAVPATYKSANDWSQIDLVQLPHMCQLRSMVIEPITLQGLGNWMGA